MKKYFDYIKNPMNIFLTLGRRNLLNWMDDETYIKIAHRIKLGERLDVDKPITYNQKIQWLKLYNRKSLYTKLVDKYNVREYIEEKIGGEYLIPLLGVWENENQIDFDKLPNQFVLKCTHDSGGLVICRDKSKLDIENAKQQLRKSLKRNYYWAQREWVYKDVPPLIIAEEYMEDEETEELRDYKFFCFNGAVKSMFVATDRATSTKFDFFDPEFNKLPFMQFYPNSNKNIEKPKLFEEMKEIAAQLSKDIPHVRVDLYEINGKIYFGEMTFFHFSGWKKFEPIEYDELFGSWLELPEKSS